MPEWPWPHVRPCGTPSAAVRAARVPTVNSSAAPTASATRLSTVEFTGLPSRRGPLTLAQRNVMRILSSTNDHFDLNFCLCYDLPPGTSIARIRYLVRRLLAQNESLRTTFPAGPEPYQLVADRGAVPVLEYEAPTDPTRFADEVALALRRQTQFDLANEPPVKVVVVTAGGAPTHALLLASHIAVDLTGARLLGRQASLLFDGRQPPPGPQPVDVALEEQSAVGRRRAAASLHYWEAQLIRTPQATFLAPASQHTDCYGIRLRSAAAAASLAEVSKRTGGSRSTVLLSALAVLLGARNDLRRITITSLSANRHTGPLRNYVGTLAQDALIVADLGYETFGDVVHALRMQTIRAYANSRFDPAALWRLIDEVQYRRGIHFARDVVFNDRSWVPDENLAPASHTSPGTGFRITRLPMESYPTRCILYVDSVHDELDVTLRANPDCLPEGEGEAVLRGLVAMLSSAADGPVALADVSAVGGIPRHVRGTGWHLVDSCWIHLDEVRRLLAAVLADRPHTVTLAGDTDARLYCHLGLDRDGLSPADIHMRCMRLLPGRANVMAPHLYRIYQPALGRTGKPGSWPEERLLWQEDGRSQDARQTEDVL